MLTSRYRWFGPFHRFVRFSEARFAKAAVSQRDRVIGDDVLVFIRPAAEAHLPLSWHSSVMTRLRYFFNGQSKGSLFLNARPLNHVYLAAGEEGDEEMFEDLYDFALKRKEEQDAQRAKQEDEEEYQPGDTNASRRCRRVFLPLVGSNLDSESDGAEADDEAANVDDQEVRDEQCAVLVLHRSKCRMRVVNC